MVYHLYVDESGKFSNQETVMNVVGGMLISGNEDRSIMPQDAGRNTPGVPSAYLESFKYDHCSENKGPARWIMAHFSMNFTIV